MIQYWYIWQKGCHLKSNIHHHTVTTLFFSFWEGLLRSTLFSLLCLNNQSLLLQFIIIIFLYFWGWMFFFDGLKGFNNVPHLEVHQALLLWKTGSHLPPQKLRLPSQGRVTAHTGTRLDGLHPGSATPYLGDLGQVTHPPPNSPAASSVNGDRSNTTSHRSATLPSSVS